MQAAPAAKRGVREREGLIWGSPAREEVSPAQKLQREAAQLAEQLKKLLASPDHLPWTSQVESLRSRIRALLTQLYFNHPLSPFSQSLDPLWLNTSHVLISAYRSIILESDDQIKQYQAKAEHSGRKSKPNPNHPAEIELKKRLTRFRQVLTSEETFYRGFIGRLINFHELEALLQGKLQDVGMTIRTRDRDWDNGDGDGDGEQAKTSRFAGISDAEKKDKVKMVYKALLCLGDLERYKAIYSEWMRKQGGRESLGAEEEIFGKAKAYYDVARSIHHSDGSVYNQMAVISTYVNDDLSTLYYYFRAMAIKNAFRGIEGITLKLLQKLLAKWKAQGGYDAVMISSDNVSRLPRFKQCWTVQTAMLILDLKTPELSVLSQSAQVDLGQLLAAREITSETIVKLVCIAIGAHWYTRSKAPVSGTGGAAGSPESSSMDHEFASLEALLATFGTLCQVTLVDVEEALQSRDFNQRDTSAIEDDDTIRTDYSKFISAAMRRILPALRIMSKWFKIHLEYLSRLARLPGPIAESISDFWQTYSRLLQALSKLFPMEGLPSLVQPLEEDLDMRGFLPLSMGLAPASDTDLINEEDELDRAHPNEEQLMRIADLQADVRLIWPNAIMLAFAPMQAELAAIPFAPPTIDRSDLASVSTETEDDPVSQAMRATLGSSSVDEEEVRVMEEDDDDEEQIVWSGTRGRDVTPPAATMDHLMISSSTPQSRLESHNQNPNPHRPDTQPGTGIAHHSQPSSLLFGAAGAGDPVTSIWSLTREESEEGMRRRVSGNGTTRPAIPPPLAASAVSNIWGPIAGVPSPNQVPARSTINGNGAAAPQWGHTYGPQPTPPPPAPRGWPAAPAAAVEAQPYWAQMDSQQNYRPVGQHAPQWNTTIPRG